jgi:hypothetical protein
MKSIKKTFHIPPSYTFTAGCSNPATVISLAPFVSSCSSPINYVGGLRPYYQQCKFLSTSSPSSSSSSSLSTAAIHSTDDDTFETPPSTSNNLDDSLQKNPFEILSNGQISSSLNKVRNESPDNIYFYFQAKLSSTTSKSSSDRRSTADQSKTATISNSTSSNKNTSKTIGNATIVQTPNEGNIVVKGTHRLADDVKFFFFIEKLFFFIKIIY